MYGKRLAQCLARALTPVKGSSLRSLWWKFLPPLGSGRLCASIWVMLGTGRRQALCSLPRPKPGQGMEWCRSRSLLGRGGPSKSPQGSC